VLVGFTFSALDQQKIERVLAMLGFQSELQVWPHNKLLHRSGYEIALSAEDESDASVSPKIFITVRSSSESKEKLIGTLTNSPKFCKVIVDIGRQDWPMFYHDFFTNTLQLIQSPVTTPLGRIMLKTTSEELACPSEDLSVARKEELRKLLLDQTVWDKHSVTATTPPPSPTSGESGDLLSNLLQSPGSAKLLNQPLPILDADSEYICSLALECLAHLFRWIPLSASIIPSLLTTIFHFACFGCDIQARKMASVNGSSQNCVLGQERGRLGVLAMSCINELMSKNCVPMEFEDYLLRILSTSCRKSPRINNAHTVKSRLEELDESCIEKFTDLLRLFVSVHLRRIESYSQFPVVEFLTVLFKYTFHQPTHEGYFSCLDIWTLFLDYLTRKTKSRLGDKEAVLNRYEDALVLLLMEVLNRIHFRYNQAQLEELDDKTLHDDQQTVAVSLEAVAKVMELLHTHAFSTLFPVLQDNLEVYLGLQQLIVTSGSGHRLNITAENDCQRLRCSLRDLSSLLQAVGHLAEYFIGDVFAVRFSDALTVLERLVKVTLYGSQIKWHNIETAVPSVLKPDLIDYCSEAHRQNTQPFITLISTTMDTVTALVSTKVRDKLLLSARHSLVSLATTKVFNRITDPSTQQLVDKAQVLVCQALSNILLLPWPNIPENEQQWPVRSINHASLISALSRDHCNLKPNAVAPQRKMPLDDTKVIIHQTLSVLEDSVENISGESAKSQQICYRSLQESVQASPALFPAFIHQSDVSDEMLSFFPTLFRGLRVQMGMPFTEQVTQTFLNMFTREELAESILHEGSTGCRVVEKFLKILQVVVQEPGQVFKPFLPRIISLCIEQVYPIIAERRSPDVKAELSELLFRTLHHNWRCFFKSTVLASVQRGIAEEQMENEPQFNSQHQAEDLPDHHALSVCERAAPGPGSQAPRPPAGGDWHRHLQRGLCGLRWLLRGLPEFLTSCDGVDANQKNALGRNFKMDGDLPSFTQNVHSLVNDLRYYRLCNDSLPPGTGKL
ncbi:hypothetical protein E2I00_008528, partial [Balaenoptera physalus]